MREPKNLYNILARKTLEKRALGILTRLWKDKIKP
jgi:hypothetical protein